MDQRGRMKKRRFIVIGCIVAALGLAGSWWALQWAMDGQYKICSIETPANNGTFEIFTDNFQEISTPLHYEVRAGGETRTPMTYFCSIPIFTSIDARSFVTRSGKKGKLVGIAFASKPDTILAMHNFVTGEDWPSGRDDGRFEITEQRGVAMIEQLRKDTEINSLERFDRYSDEAIPMSSSSE
jgi:hypothetical protein